jgi:hypothetical protein
MSQGRSVPARCQIGHDGQKLQALRGTQRSSDTTHIEFGIMRVADFAKIVLFSASC